MKTLFLSIIALIPTTMLSAQNPAAGKASAITSLDQSFYFIVPAGSTTAALEKLETATNLHFSYNPDVLPKTVTKDTWTDISFRQGLDRMLGKQYAYRLRGNYIIIRTLQEGQITNGKQEYAITGYIKDKKTGKAIPFASVYDTTSLKAALSDKDGYFELSVSDTLPKTIGVIVPHEKDTFLVVSPLRRIETSINKYFIPEIQALSSIAHEAIDTISSSTFWNRQASGLQKVSDDLKDKLPKTIQVTSKKAKISPESIVQLGLNYGSTWPLMPEMQLGIPQFYNRFTFAPGQFGNKLWGVGYGLGTQLGAKNGRGVAIEVLAMGLYPGHIEEIPLMGTVSVMPIFRLGRNIKLIVGPEANAAFTHGIRAPREGYQLPPQQGLSASFPMRNGREMTAFFSWRVKLVIE